MIRLIASNKTTGESGNGKNKIGGGKKRKKQFCKKRFINKKIYIYYGG